MPEASTGNKLTANAATTSKIYMAAYIHPLPCMNVEDMITLKGIPSNGTVTALPPTTTGMAANNTNQIQ